MRVVLASASPARLLTLRAAGVDPVIHVSGVDESAIRGTDTAQLTTARARAKGESVFEEIEPREDTVVIACDSMLELAGQQLGKPRSRTAAIEAWRRMRGRAGTLYTGHHVIVRVGGDTQRATRHAATRVRFGDLTDAEIDAYVATGEPEKVAGAFTIDGYGGAYITSLEGDPHNVVGLSLPLLRLMLTDMGVAWHSLWRPTG